MKLSIIDFIKANKDWETILPKRPYCVDITKDTVNGRNLVMLKYDQIAGPDFSLDIVRECRGLILDIDTLEPISVPFYKFGNYGESWVNQDELDWTTAKTYEKVDGSLIKITFDDNGKYIISTNGMIDAYKGIIPLPGCPYNSYGQLVSEIINEKFHNMLDKLYNKYFFPNITYMFELTSPWNVIVVPHKENNLWVLGARDNKSLKEISIETLRDTFGDILKYPKQYNISSLTDAIETARDMPWDDEGYVIVDKNYNRIKVKSPEYLYAHHLRGEGVMGRERAIKIVFANEIEEICAYFPQYRPILESVKKQLENIERNLIIIRNHIDISNYPTRKELHEWINGKYDKIEFSFAFSYYTDRTIVPKDYIRNQTIAKLIKALDFSAV